MTTTRTRTHTHTFTAMDLVKPLVKSILEHPHDHEWSLQGFGMLRTYLVPELRLHVWDSRFRVEDVSAMHTHPWNFYSYVVAGEVRNTRFDRRLGVEGQDRLYREQEILCGPGGHQTDSEPALVRLMNMPVEVIGAGHTYTQYAHEIHRSDPADGTVTIIAREFLDDADHAYVYVPAGAEWVSAEPRPATREEIDAICTDARARWF